MPPKMGGMGYKESSGFDTVGFTGTQSESSFEPPSPLHECLQFRVAAASEAANRNVGFTSKRAIRSLATKVRLDQPRSEWRVTRARRRATVDHGDREERERGFEDRHVFTRRQSLCRVLGFELSVEPQ